MTDERDASGDETTEDGHDAGKTRNNMDETRNEMNETRNDTDETRGTFLVVRADDETAVVRDVDGGRIHTLAANPGIETDDPFEEDDVLEATIAPEPPLELTWTLITLHERRSIPLERGTEPPTSRTREIATAQDNGEVTRVERAGTGEIHVLSVPDGRTHGAVADVLEDEATRERAARLGVARVEVRAANGVVSVRYLP